MTTTYDVTQLATSQLYQVRWLIGDTDMTAAQFQDEEINFALTQWASLYSVVGQCFRTLAAKYARLADTSAGSGVRVNHSQKAKAYNELAARAENLGKALGGALAYAGGTSIADKAKQVADADRVPSQFSIGMEDDYLPLGQVLDTDQNQQSAAVGARTII